MDSNKNRILSELQWITEEEHIDHSICETAEEAHDLIEELSHALDYVLSNSCELDSGDHRINISGELYRRILELLR
jgi:hypothetical protein